MSLPTTRRVRRAAVVVAAAALLLSGCGGDGESTADESAGSATPTATATSAGESESAAGASDFCDNFVGGGAASGAGGPGEWAEQLRDADLPEDMPEQARDGLDRTLTVLQETAADPSALQQELMKLGTQAQQEVQAFGLYVANTCSEQLQGLLEDLPSNLPSNLPSGLPSDLPSNLPSEFPSDLPTG